MIITSSAKPILNIKREMTTSYSVPLQFCLFIILSQLFKSLNHLITYLVVPHFSQEVYFKTPSGYLNLQVVLNSIYTMFFFLYLHTCNKI